MPGTSTSENPSGVKICFDERTHRYWTDNPDGTRTDYVSGTTFVHRFVPAFDEESASRRVAERRGVPQEQVLEEWRRKRDESCLFGTRVHEVAEDVLLGRTPRNSPSDERERAAFGRAETVAGRLKADFDILGVEKIVFSPQLEIAGTIDLLARSRRDGAILVLDWKTNSEIRRENQFENCLPPIRHLQSANFVHYALQLSLYQFLLSWEGYVPEGSKFRRAIIHIGPETAETIHTPDLSLEIRDMVISGLSRTPS